MLVCRMDRVVGRALPALAVLAHLQTGRGSMGGQHGAPDACFAATIVPSTRALIHRHCRVVFGRFHAAPALPGLRGLAGQRNQQVAPEPGWHMRGIHALQRTPGRFFCMRQTRAMLLLPQIRWHGMLLVAVPIGGHLETGLEFVVGNTVKALWISWRWGCLEFPDQRPRVQNRSETSRFSYTRFSGTLSGMFSVDFSGAFSGADSGVS